MICCGIEADWPALESSAQPSGTAIRERQPSYDILTEQELVQRQSLLIARIIEQLFLSPAEASTLLRWYRWNIQNLINDWLDDPEKVFRSRFAPDVLID